jgi:hypothetical protein
VLCVEIKMNKSLVICVLILQVTLPYAKKAEDKYYPLDITDEFEGYETQESFDFLGGHYKPHKPGHGHSHGHDCPKCNKGLVCYRGGCSGEICSHLPDQVSPCIYKPEYECYKEAMCEPQCNGTCGFTVTPKLVLCLIRSQIHEEPKS